MHQRRQGVRLVAGLRFLLVPLVKKYVVGKELTPSPRSAQVQQGASVEAGNVRSKACNRS